MSHCQTVANTMHRIESIPHLSFTKPAQFADVIVYISTCFIAICPNLLHCICVLTTACSAASIKLKDSTNELASCIDKHQECADEIRTNFSDATKGGKAGAGRSKRRRRPGCCTLFVCPAVVQVKTCCFHLCCGCELIHTEQHLLQQSSVLQACSISMISCLIGTQLSTLAAQAHQVQPRSVKPLNQVCPTTYIWVIKA